MSRPPDDLIARPVARYILEIPQFVGDAEDPRDALNAVFDLLEHGLTKAVQIRSLTAPGAAKSS